MGCYIRYSRKYLLNVYPKMFAIFSASNTIWTFCVFWTWLALIQRNWTASRYIQLFIQQKLTWKHKMEFYWIFIGLDNLTYNFKFYANLKPQQLTIIILTASGCCGTVISSIVNKFDQRCQRSSQVCSAQAPAETVKLKPEIQFTRACWNQTQYFYNNI